MSKYRQYIRNSPDWKQKRQERLDFDEYRCQVCGAAATEVHHLTYDHLFNEKLCDLVSLCTSCHKKAEDIYNSRKVDWSSHPTRPFSLLLRYDAETVAKDVLDYILTVRGSDVDSILALRQAEDGEKYWSKLKNIVNILCHKRYEEIYGEERRVKAVDIIADHTVTVALGYIKHELTNSMQHKLFEKVHEEHDAGHKWNKLAEEHHITSNTMNRIKKDDGSSSGPTLKDDILTYHFYDAIHGIEPKERFDCISDEEYQMISAVARFIKEEK